MHVKDEGVEGVVDLEGIAVRLAESLNKRVKVHKGEMTIFGVLETSREGDPRWRVFVTGIIDAYADTLFKIRDIDRVTEKDGTVHIYLKLDR